MSEITTVLTERLELPGSRAVYERALKASPGGVHGDGRFYSPHPIYFTKAQGSTVVDADGNSYVDFHSGFGAVLLGHSHEDWLRRTMERARDGICLAAANVPELELAETLLAAMPSMDRVALCSTGSEATFHAIRLARVATGRRKILKFEGTYHGWHDYVAWSTHFDPSKAGGPAEAPIPVPSSAGLGDFGADEIVVCGYNDTKRLREIFTEIGSEIAAIIVEPVFHNAGVILPKEGFLAACRELCDAQGAVLISDEVITGVRHAIGGVSEALGLDADIVTMAKALANGVPIGMFAMKASLADLLKPRGPVLYAGTFNGNHLSVSAARSCLEILSESNEVYEQIEETSSRLEHEMRAVIAASDFRAQWVRYGSVWALYFENGDVRDVRHVPNKTGEKGAGVENSYRNHLLRSGFYVHPHYMLRGYVSASHTGVDIDRFVEANAEFFKLAPESVGQR